MTVTTYFTDYKIAAGVSNTGGLAPIGSIVATSNIAFPEPAGAQGSYTPGIIKIRLDQQLVTVGKSRQVWLLYGLTFEQYRYLQSTYCGGGFSGKVTIRTRWQHTSYANYNAVLQLQHENLQETIQGYASVALTFVDLVVIP
jgi:hypothetical protein